MPGLPNPVFIKVVDIAQPEQAMAALRELADDVGDVELYVVSCGVGYIHPTLEYNASKAFVSNYLEGLRQRCHGKRRNRYSPRSGAGNGMLV